MENSGLSIKNRNQEIDILKGFAMVCVIIGHSIIGYPIDITHVPWCVTLHNFIYGFHMELLFLLSGFLYKNKNYLVYMKGKIHRILIPYLIWGALFMLMPVLFSSVVHRDTSLLDGVKNYLLYGGGYWFLYVLFLIFLIYPLIGKLSKWLKMGLLVVVLIINYFYTIPKILCIRDILFYLPFFIIGDLFSVFCQTDFCKKLKKYIGIIALCCLSLFVFNKCYMDDTDYFIHFFSTIILMACIYICMHYIYVLSTYTGDVMLDKVVSVLSLCGTFSLQLYLFNGFLLVPLRVLLCSILHVTNPFAIVTFISVFDITISLLICKYLLPKCRVLSYICGVKANS